MNVNELPQYKCHKVVRAGRIHSCIGGVLSVQVGNAKAVVEFDVGREWVKKHQPERDGYFVVYEDGYQSYSPAAAFEAGYSLIIDKDSNGTVLAQNADGTETLHFQGSTPASTEIDLDAADFSDALMWLKEGKRVQRAGWNGKGQFVEIWRMAEGLSWPTGPHPSQHVPMKSCFVLVNAQGEAQPGWVPSMGDLMATDWQVYVEPLETDMPPHQLRVLAEMADLADKHQKLLDFTGTERFASLPEAERDRLARQHLAMGDYLNILAERVAAF